MFAKCTHGRRTPPAYLLGGLVALAGISLLMACCTAEPRPEAPPVTTAIPATPSPPPAPARVKTAPQAPAVTPPKVDVSIEDLRPYFTSKVLRKALGDFKARRNETSARAFAAAAETVTDRETARAARFMSLLAFHDAGIWDPTAQKLEAMAIEWPLMAPYAQLYAGLCHLETGRPDAARKAFAEIPSDSPLSARAGESLAKAWVALDRLDRAITALSASLGRHPTARASAWQLLAELREKAGDNAGATDARRELASRMPASPEGRAALRALGENKQLSVPKLRKIANAAYKAQSHRRALKAMDAVMEATEPGSEPHCDAVVKKARTYRKMKKHRKAWTTFVKALGCTGEPLADATFAGGRNRLRAGEHEKAIRLFRRHINAFPKRSTVDDALLYIAEAQRKMGDEGAAQATLLSTLRDRTHGDMVEEVAWALLWPLIDSRKWKAATKMADTILTLVPRETNCRAEGRTLYWRARSLQRRRKHDQAMAGYRGVLETYPLSWYALLAHERLQGYGEEEATAAVKTALKAATPPPSPLGSIPDALWSNPHFRRGAELVRMGLTKSARRELEAVVVKTDKVDRRALNWTKIALYELAGAPDMATRLARREERYFGAHWPVGEHRKLWELAHQRGFSNLVERWARRRSIDPLWVYAIIRSESGFNPKVESWANAIGLMQIIMPTAKHLVEGTRHRATPANLRKPAVAIELGTKFLATLLERHPSMPLASAGYNAGGGAVAGWRKKWGRQGLDEFVERIPYAETRAYAKCVTRSVARYHWLATGGEILDVPLNPPGRP